MGPVRKWRYYGVVALEHEPTNNIGQSGDILLEVCSHAALCGCYFKLHCWIYPSSTYNRLFSKTLADVAYKPCIIYWRYRKSLNQSSLKKPLLTIFEVKSKNAQYQAVIE